MDASWIDLALELPGFGFSFPSGRWDFSPAGHFPDLEEPERFAELLFRFLRA